MAYTISLSNGTSLLGTTGLGDGSVNSTATSLSLIGKNYPNYGQLLNEDLVHLLENFANSEAPGAPLPGQIWWDTSARVLKLNTAATRNDTASWKIVPTMFNEPDVGSISGTPTQGDLWYDSSNKQLRVYTGTVSDGVDGWVLVGPLSTASSGATGAIPDTIVDSIGVSHVVIKFFVNNVLTGIFSGDATFVAATPISGWGDGTIRKGLNLAPGLGLQYYGNANVAINLWHNGSITSGDDFLTTSAAAGSYLALDGSTTMTGNITVSSANTKTLGSTTNWWNTVYATTFTGTSVRANYADLAERFEADQPYSAGTVVELGGSAEITAVQEDLSEAVFGVVSTQAAYLMNSGSGTDETHPPIAVSGRVPVNVVGKVRRGDRLVSAGNGYARAAGRTEITPWNVIGRALSNKTDIGPGVIEAIVKIAS